jgi:arsenate reductase
MPVTIYYNPKCETSRNALALIRERGIEPQIIEYLKTPLGKQGLRALIRLMKVPVRDVVRWKEPLAAELKLEGADDDTLIEAMATHPILVNRPIVVTAKGAMLCRPSETVAEVL